MNQSRQNNLSPFSELNRKCDLLEQQYIEAAQDEQRNKIFDEWERLSEAGLNEKNGWQNKTSVH